MKRRAFTLLELILANVVVAILLGGVMLMVSGLGRERRAMANVGPDPAEAVIEALRWDLANAEVAWVTPKARGFILDGNGGLDQRTLAPTGRRTRVAYELRRRGDVMCLTRYQGYLDDAVRIEAWEEVVAVGVDRLSMLAEGVEAGDADDVAGFDQASSFAMPARVRVQIGIRGRVVERELVLR